MAEVYKRIDRKLVHKGAIIDYYQDTVQIPNGNVATWDFIMHKGAAAAFPVTEEGKILMVKQYRNALDRFTIEIPAGGLNGADEPTMDAARRELEEETGYVASDMKLLVSVRTTVAFCNEKIDIYLATGLKRTAQHLDEDEFVDVEAYDLEELVELVKNGSIEDAKTVSAIMTYKALYT